MTGHNHHRARYHDDTVERARSMHDAGVSPTEIAERLQVPINTLNDWLYYRTRTRLAA